MANITFTFGAKTKTYTITAPNAARLTAWATAAYPTIPNPAFDATKPVDPVSNPQTIVNPDPVISAIDGLWSGIRANVQNFERTQAQAAVATPADLT